MILIDTSVWIDHIRLPDINLQSLLQINGVLVHPYVIGEIALGSMRGREFVVRRLQALPEVVLAKHDEAMQFVETHKLFGTGLGYVDVHLLASCRLTPGASLWTRDKRLGEIAAQMHIGAVLA